MKEIENLIFHDGFKINKSLHSVDISFVCVCVYFRYFFFHKVAFLFILISFSLLSADILSLESKRK